MHRKNIITAGKDLRNAGKALIMLHGRGGTAQHMLSLAEHLAVEDFALVAPQATNNTWYPFSFMVVPKRNEPWLSGALQVLKETVDDLVEAGIPKENIYFLGFSQGACLTLEFVARHATRWGGVVAFTGGLIGEKIHREAYHGDFAGTPVFIGTSNPDTHVPVERVYATANILREMGADVTERVYDGMGHTINQNEIDLANHLILSPQTVPLP